MTKEKIFSIAGYKVIFALLLLTLLQLFFSPKWNESWMFVIVIVAIGCTLLYNWVLFELKKLLKKDDIADDGSENTGLMILFLVLTVVGLIFHAGIVFVWMMFNILKVVIDSLDLAVWHFILWGFTLNILFADFCLIAPWFYGKMVARWIKFSGFAH